ncbi:MAG: DegV family protein [Clostridia bacterium]|nr:DegV family protein [Clostridia bacterium]
MSLRIVVDSTADMPEELKNQFTIVPLNVTFDSEQYIDGVTIDRTTFYKKLEGCSKLPTTSQPSPAAYMHVFEEAKKAGDTLVVLAVSSKISGTYQSAMIAAQDYPENVYVVDTLHVANAFGILAEYALQLAGQGKSAQEIVDAITIQRDKVQLFALLDTLEYLEKGGRISRTAAFAGTLLSLKPIVYFKDGTLRPLGKARGMKQGQQMLVKEISAAGIDFDKPYLMGYTGLSEEKLQKFIQDNDGLWQDSSSVRSVQLCSVVGTHAGPGAIVAAFFKKN